MDRRTLLGALGTVPLLTTFPAAAQGPWRPDRPIRFIVGFAAGGSTDTSGRLVANAISGPLGQPVVVENRVGGAGNIGTEHVARSAPDGYTYVVASVGTHATNQFLYRNLPFHVVNDFAPVSLVLVSAAVAVVRPSLPIRSIAELIAYARANPGKINLGTSGVGGTQHFAAALFEQKAGVTFTHIPYRGGAPAMADLVAGRLDLVFSPLAETMSFIQSGQVRPLGVTRTERMPALPEVPPISDTVAGYAFNSWIGIFAPARTPANIIQVMSDSIAAGVRAPEVRQRMEGLGYLPVGGGPEQLADIQRRDVALMEELVRLTGASAD
ncbi:Bug family tripartite tricarboxylate transporter substrate binding protein [Neoroseomonas soli]|uniref:Tripartite tricarboxylate transporter substrate binding protein n=1 Tax=Neoroseomonas soli TaxID=1081025 RepID=A0A9X9X006_9PROT|nr:tripartite tricarboxylate transporter substrate binding protein [Neoroseomonas soli]MBR0672735.1 tripartite tricarboxylate transporter substrate binding protein [Neoroseomonas soli]